MNRTNYDESENEMDDFDIIPVLNFSALLKELGIVLDDK